MLAKKKFEHEYSGTVAKTELVTVSVERGMSWEKAMDVWRDHVGSEDGFYLNSNVSSTDTSHRATSLLMMSRCCQCL